MSEIKLVRTDSLNPDFRALVQLLNDELAVYNGDENDFYMQYNKIENLHHVTVAYINEIPMGCGAIKEYSPDTAEVKRMYVKTDARGNGIGKLILSELEKWAKELNFKYAVMETGKFLTAAVNLYKKSGYSVIPNYGPYEGVENSICFKKEITI